MEHWLIAFAIVVGCCILSNAIHVYAELVETAIENAVLRLELLLTEEVD